MQMVVSHNCGLAGIPAMSQPRPWSILHWLSAESAVLGSASHSLIKEHSQVLLLTMRLVGVRKEHSSLSQFCDHSSDFKMYCCVEDWFRVSITTSLQKSRNTLAERPHNFQSNLAVTNT